MRLLCVLWVAVCAWLPLCRAIDVPCEMMPILNCLKWNAQDAKSYFCLQDALKTVQEPECYTKLGWKPVFEDANPLEASEPVTRRSERPRTSLSKLRVSKRKLSETEMDRLDGGLPLLSKRKRLEDVEEEEEEEEAEIEALAARSGEPLPVSDDFTDLSKETCELLKMVPKFAASPRLNLCAERPKESTVGVQYGLTHKKAMRMVLAELYSTEVSFKQAMHQYVRIICKPLRIIVEHVKRFAGLMKGSTEIETRMLTEAFGDLFRLLESSTAPPKFIGALKRMLSNGQWPFLDANQFTRLIANNERVFELTTRFVADLDRAVQLLGPNMNWDRFGSDPLAEVDFDRDDVLQVCKKWIGRLCLAFGPSIYAFDIANGEFAGDYTKLAAAYGKSMADYMRLVRGDIDAAFVKEHDPMKTTGSGFVNWLTGQYALKGQTDDYDIDEFIAFVRGKPFFPPAYNQNTLASNMITVVQRGPRYKLLLNDVLLDRASKLEPLGLFKDDLTNLIKSVINDVLVAMAMSNDFEVNRMNEMSMATFPALFRSLKEVPSLPDKSPNKASAVSFPSPTRCFVNIFYDVHVKRAEEPESAYKRCNAIAFNDMILFIDYHKSRQLKLPFVLQYALVLPTDAMVMVTKSITRTSKDKKKVGNTYFVVMGQNEKKERMDLNLLRNGPRIVSEKQETDELVTFLGQVAVVLYNKGTPDPREINSYVDPVNVAARRAAVCFEASRKDAFKKAFYNEPAFTPFVAAPWVNTTDSYLNRGCFLCQLASQDVMSDMALDVGNGFSGGCEIYTDHRNEEELSACKVFRCLSANNDARKVAQKWYELSRKIHTSVSLQYSMCRTVPGLSDYCVGAKEFESAQKCWACVHTLHAARHGVIDKLDRGHTESFQFASYICQRRLGFDPKSEPFTKCLRFFGLRPIFAKMAVATAPAASFWKTFSEFASVYSTRQAQDGRKRKRRDAVADILSGELPVFDACVGAKFCDCGAGKFEQADYDQLLAPVKRVDTLPALPRPEPRTDEEDLLTESFPSQLRTSQLTPPSSTKSSGEPITPRTVTPTSSKGRRDSGRDSGSGSAPQVIRVADEMVVDEEDEQ